MKIGYVARQDFLTKSGGDTVQWKIYHATAEAYGHECVTWFDDSPMPDVDLFHVLNIDRPLEVFPKMRAAQKRGIPYVISTIHHPNEWLARLRKSEPPGGALGIVFYRIFGGNIATAESIKEVVRLANDGRLSHLFELYPSWTKRIRWLLSHARRLLVCSSKETQYLKRDFQVDVPPEKERILPNWVDGFDDDSRECSALRGFSEPPVLVVGRIEPRKNVRRIAELAAQVGREVVFIGKANPNEPDYVQEFNRIVRGASHLRWIPGVPREELSSCYRMGSFLLNGSYVEVSPMVDIEALYYGCPIATTRYALHHEYLPAETPQVDAHDDDTIVHQLTWTPTRIASGEVVNASQCREFLMRIYEEAIAEHEERT